MNKVETIDNIITLAELRGYIVEKQSTHLIFFKTELHFFGAWVEKILIGELNLLDMSFSPSTTPELLGFTKEVNDLIILITDIK